jgi:hypothetical protein
MYRCQSCAYRRACPNCQAGLISAPVNSSAFRIFQKGFDERRRKNANKGVLFNRDFEFFKYFLENMAFKV